jgi:sporulation protein YlmC with PRC-barrel domain
MTLGKFALVGAASLFAISAAMAQTSTSPMTPPAQSPSAPSQDTSPMTPQRSPGATPSAPSTTGPAPIVRDTAPRAALPSSITDMSAKQLVGKSVYNTAGDRIGEVDDVVISKSGSQTAAVIGVGGFLGIGEKKVALPVNQLQVQDNKIVAMGLSEDSAKRLPEYRRDDWNKVEGDSPLTRQ